MGKKEKTKIKTRKIMDTMLRGRPARPRLNLDGSKGSPRIRFNVMQEMETMYEAMMAAVEREAMFKSAAEEPRLMRESRQDTPKARQMAFIGTSNLGWT
jgi:hypothetical protein